MAIEKSIPRAESAESIGINSSVVAKMTEEMAFAGINLHSLMIVKNGFVGVEAYGDNLSADIPHMVYSVSKSFLATAYGFALHEGKVTRETRFLYICPEFAPKKKDEYLEKLTIHHLVTMTAGKQPTIGNVKNGNRIKAFVESKWIFSPGESWRYVNDNYFVAAEMLYRILGETITEYLTPRLYVPLGIEIPFWERSSNGVEAGGWGLMLKTEDMAKFILCYHNKGMYNGTQVIPAWWVKEATAKYIDNNDVEEHSDSAAGYGCGFWRCAGVENAYRAEGMFCQYAICLEDYDACIVMTSDHSDLQETLDVLWKYVPDMFDNQKFEKPRSVSLKKNESVVVRKRSSVEKSISDKTYRIRRCKFVNAIGLPVSIFPMPIVFFADECGGNMDSLKFVFNESGCDFSWVEDGGFENKVHLSMRGMPVVSKVKIGELNLSVHSFAYWENENTLVMRFRPLEAVAERVLTFVFNGKKVKMYPSSVPGTGEKAKSIGNKLKCILKGRFFHWWIDFLVPKVDKILNPTHYGKI